MPAESIGPYTVLRRICQTASSELFLASDPRRRREVALKVVLPQLVGDKRVLREYGREVDVSQHFDHPCVVKVYDFISDAERPYLVMQYIHGQTLKRTIYRETDLVLSRGFHWLVRAAQGLGHMHSQGFVHMDVKPENLLVQADGKAAMIDLALTREYGRRGLMASLKARFSGATQGTRSYMSPEQIRSDALTPAADIYSLGIVIFEMFSRRLPLTATDPNAILQLHLKTRPPMLHHVVGDIHPQLSALVARMLEKHPEARPQTMDQVIDALARIGHPLQNGAAQKRRAST